MRGYAAVHALTAAVRLPCEFARSAHVSLSVPRQMAAANFLIIYSRRP